MIITTFDSFINCVTRVKHVATGRGRGEEWLEGQLVFFRSLRLHRLGTNINLFIVLVSTYCCVINSLAVHVMIYSLSHLACMSDSDKHYCKSVYSGNGYCI